MTRPWESVLDDWNEDDEHARRAKKLMGILPHRDDEDAVRILVDVFRQLVAKPRRPTAKDNPYERNPEEGPCRCGLKTVPAGADVVSWYWQRHGRTDCTLELPNNRCWCGLLRSEHVTGHKLVPRVSVYCLANDLERRERCLGCGYYSNEVDDAKACEGGDGYAGHAFVPVDEHGMSLHPNDKAAEDAKGDGVLCPRCKGRGGDCAGCSGGKTVTPLTTSMSERCAVLVSEHAKHPGNLWKAALVRARDARAASPWFHVRYDNGVETWECWLWDAESGARVPIWQLYSRGGDHWSGMWMGHGASAKTAAEAIEQANACLRSKGYVLDEAQVDSKERCPFTEKHEEHVGTCPLSVERPDEDLGPCICPPKQKRGIPIPTVTERELMKPTSHEEAIEMLRRWTESLGCTAPEDFERKLMNHAMTLVHALNGARVKAYLAGIASEQRERKEKESPAPKLSDEEQEIHDAFVAWTGTPPNKTESFNSFHSFEMHRYPFPWDATQTQRKRLRAVLWKLAKA